MVRRNDPVAMFESVDQASEEKGPGGVSVEHQDWRVLWISFINKVVLEIVDNEAATSKIIGLLQGRRQFSVV